MRGQALRYLGWQFTDRALPRLLVASAISVAMFSLVYLAAGNQPPNPDQALMVMFQMFAQFGLLFALMLAHGIVSEDRTQGYYRFYLSKPVSPTWFYGQHLVTAFLVMIASTAVFIIAGGLALRTGFAWGLLRNGTAIFLLYGLMIFFFSTLHRRDWLLASLVLIASAIARGRWPAGRSTTGDVLHAILPPQHLLSWNADFTAARWVWLAAWGLGLFVAGLLILRLRPLGED